MKEVDVIIISWAKNEELLRVTEKGIVSLLESEDPEEIKFNVIVVESNHNINYNERLGLEMVKTIHPTEAFGYNKYLNIGIREGSSPYVVLCNSDLTYESGWATEIIKLMEEHPEFMSASPWCPQTQGSNESHKGTIYSGYRVRGELAGWCIFQQRSIYEKIGSLSEDVDFWYSDNIYADQIRLRGIKHALVSNSVVNHHDGNLGKTGNQVDARKKFEYTNGQASKYQLALKRLNESIQKENHITNK